MSTPKTRIAGRMIPSNKAESLICSHASYIFVSQCVYIYILYLNPSYSCTHYVRLLCVSLAVMYILEGSIIFTMHVKLSMLGKPKSLNQEWPPIDNFRLK